MEGSAHPDALGVLRQTYERSLNPWGQCWAAHAIASLPDEGRWSLLYAELASPVWRVRMICIRALAAHPGAKPALLRALHDPAWRVRDAAARALGHVQADEAVLEALTGSLNDEDQRVAATAERALDRLRTTI